MTETPSTSTGDELPATAWVTVAEAADKAGVPTSTVRQWYRSGRVPTQRAEGDHGAFLVPLDAVEALVRGDDDADDLTAEVIDLNASYWSAQTEAAREEATAARNELADVRAELEAMAGELERLRSQVQEGADEARRLRERAEDAEAEAEAARETEPVPVESSELDATLAALRAELAEVRAELGRTEEDLDGAEDELEQTREELEQAKRALQEATLEVQQAKDDAQRSAEELQQVRDELQQTTAELDRSAHDLERAEGRLEVIERQLAQGQAELAKLREISTAVGSITDNSWLELPTNSYRSPVRPQGMAAAGDLSGLLAATQPDRSAAAPADDEADPGAAEPELAPVEPIHDPDAPDEADSLQPRPHHPLGEHGDDLLPQPEKKGRRGRR